MKDAKTLTPKLENTDAQSSDYERWIITKISQI